MLDSMHETFLAISMFLGWLMGCIILVMLFYLVTHFLIRIKEKKTEKTVHCNTCIHYEVEEYKSRHGSIHTRYHCTHRSNIIHNKDWKERWYIYKKHPRKLNRNMDCPNYVNWNEEKINED